MLTSNRKNVQAAKGVKINLKPLKDQVIVITGASSGIGLVTARMARAEGARLVVAARNESALRQLSDEINQYGLGAVYVEADVGKEEDVQRIADSALRTFGGFDTWINNAGVSVIGDALNVPVGDLKKMFDTNFWGVVYGSRAAARHFISSEKHGAIINVGSFLGERHNALQAGYTATKQAVHAWTDSLRAEMESDHQPVSVSLIQPAKTNTPFAQHARTYAQGDLKEEQLMYAPEVVAEAILFCAQNPRREIQVGLQSRLMNVMNSIAPGLVDLVMDRPSPHEPERGSERSPGALENPGGELKERGTTKGVTRSTSYYVKASKYPFLSTLLVAGLGAGLYLFSKRKQPPESPEK